MKVRLIFLFNMNVNLILILNLNLILNLILILNLGLWATGDDRLVLTKSVDIRGDNDESWRRGMAYMLCDLAKRRKRPPRYGMPP